MLNKLFSIFVLMILLHTKSLYAHGNHVHLGDADVIEIATAIAEQLVDFDANLGFGKLKPSWRDLPAHAASIHSKTADYYIASVSNKAENRILFLLISVEGDLYDANFTGEFPDLKP